MQNIDFMKGANGLKVGDTIAVTEKVEVKYGFRTLNPYLTKSFEIHLLVESVSKTQFIASGKRFMFNKYGSNFANGYGDNKLTAKEPQLTSSQDEEFAEYQIFIDELHTANAVTPDLSLLKAKSIEAAKEAIELSKQTEALRKKMRTLLIEEGR